MFTSGVPMPVLQELDVIGGETIQNDACRICFSNNRTRLLLEYLTRQLKVTESTFYGSVLHVSPEYGILQKLRANPRLAYTAVDLSPDQYIRDTDNCVSYCDLTAMPYQDGTFELIMCSHVLEHIPDDR
jgi:2-polyprenyl-3-methyl-5-hydroxy-6-metoxy-1,4-benzoquinol methylase